jgi:TonB family protein
LIGPALSDFFPREAQIRAETGTAVVGVVVGTDGRIFRAALLKSTGYPALDKAAFAWLSQVGYETPAYLDATPVRFYKVLSVTFRVG